MKEYKTECFILPKGIQNVTGQTFVPIGDAVIRTSDSCIGYEICEELWNPDSSLMKQCLSGIDITMNSSGGFHEIGGTKDVMNVIKSATSKYGGIYVFSNLRGCDGDRVYYHGTSHITMNGNISVIGEQFSLKNVEVITTTLDLDDVLTYRKNICRSVPEVLYEGILVDYCISSNTDINKLCNVSNPVIYEDGEEIALGPACWLWDYLRRSNFNSLLLPLDGRLDSSSSAVIVYSMCNLVCKAINEGNMTVLSDLQKIINVHDYVPKNAKELCQKILVTCHMDTNNLGDKTIINSKKIAIEIGSKHIIIPIQSIMFSVVSMLCAICAKAFNIERNNWQVEHILQSNYERINMIFLYILAEILSFNNSHRRFLILGSGNAEKAVLGCYAKFGYFSGDINVTGAISSKNLKQFLKYSQHHFRFASLERLVVSADEEINFTKIGTLDDIELLCKLKKNYYGPYSTFAKLVSRDNKKKVEYISKQVKKFFSLYSQYHHKSYSVAPCLHLGSYATVNSYYDQRQILYNCNWTWQFRAIDDEVKMYQSMHCAEERTI